MARQGWLHDELVLVDQSQIRYGQALGEASDHYEETNSAGWDLEADVLAAVAALTGNADPAEVNPTFPGGGGVIALTTCLERPSRVPIRLRR